MGERGDGEGVAFKFLEYISSSFSCCFECRANVSEALRSSKLGASEFTIVAMESEKTTIVY